MTEEGAGLFELPPQIVALTPFSVIFPVTSRANKIGGLACSNKQGFVDHDVLNALQLQGGTCVDQVRKRYLPG